MLTSDTPRKEPDCCRGTTHGSAYKVEPLRRSACDVFLSALNTHFPRGSKYSPQRRVRIFVLNRNEKRLRPALCRNRRIYQMMIAPRLSADFRRGLPYLYLQRS